MKINIPVIRSESHVKNLTACLDSELEEKFSFNPIGWEFHILIKSELDKINSFFFRGRDFTYIGKEHLIYYPKFRKAISIKVLPYLEYPATTGEILLGSLEDTPEGLLKEHSLFQKSNFNMTLSFNRDIRSINPNEDIFRTNADAVRSVIKLLMHQNVPFCIPYRPIVYWPEIKQFSEREVEAKK